MVSSRPIRVGSPSRAACATRGQQLSPSPCSRRGSPRTAEASRARRMASAARGAARAGSPMISTRIRNGGWGSPAAASTGTSAADHTPASTAIAAAPSTRATPAQPVLADVHGGEVGPRGGVQARPARDGGVPGRRVPVRDPQPGGHPHRGARAGRADRGHRRADVSGPHRLGTVRAARVQVDGLGPGGDRGRRVPGQLRRGDRHRGIFGLAALPVEAGLQPPDDAVHPRVLRRPSGHAPGQLAAGKRRAGAEDGRKQAARKPRTPGWSAVQAAVLQDVRAARAGGSRP